MFHIQWWAFVCIRNCSAIKSMMQTVSMCWLQPFPSRLPYDIVRCNLNFISFFFRCCCRYTRSLSLSVLQTKVLSYSRFNFNNGGKHSNNSRLLVNSLECKCKYWTLSGNGQTFPRPHAVAVRKKRGHTRDRLRSPANCKRLTMVFVCVFGAWIFNLYFYFARALTVHHFGIYWNCSWECEPIVPSK